MQAHVPTTIFIDNSIRLSARRQGRGCSDDRLAGVVVVWGALGGLRVLGLVVDADGGIVMVPWAWGAGWGHVCGTSDDTVDSGRSGG